MWLIRVILFALLISPSKFPASSLGADSVSYYGLACLTKEHCNAEKTHLKCLLKPNSDGSICACGFRQKFDNNLKQCTLNVGHSCNVDDGAKCMTGAFCAQHRDKMGNLQKEGECCMLNDPENSDEFCKFSAESRIKQLELSPASSFLSSERHRNEHIMEVSQPQPQSSEQVTVTASLYDRSCTTDESCDRSKTFLKCFATPSGSKCKCSRVAEFDSDRQICLLIIGADCDLPTEANRDPQRCVKHGKCVAHTDLRGKKLTQGTCCDPINQKSCIEYEEVTSTTTEISTFPNTQFQPQVENLNGKKCEPSNRFPCQERTTHLKCVFDVNKSGYFCDCGKNNVYDSSQNQCLLGVGNVCRAQTNSNMSPQQCVPSAECIFPASSKVQGECICKPESTDPPCDKENKNKDRNLDGEEMNQRACSNDADCRRDKTFLKCLLSNPMGTEKICDCGINNVYDPNLKMCSLGLGNQCVVGKTAQKCSLYLECTLNGRRVNQHEIVGTCTCIYGQSQSSRCNEYLHFKSVATLPRTPLAVNFHLAVIGLYTIHYFIS